MEGVPERDSGPARLEGLGGVFRLESRMLSVSELLEGILALRQGMIDEQG